MNDRYTFLLLLLSLWVSTDLSEKIISSHHSILWNSTEERKKLIDTEKSVVSWRGTKLMGTRHHEGTVKFSEGWLNFKNGRIQNGQFVVDMSSIYVTDIPLDQPRPRQSLTRHLNSDFKTRTFPSAFFEINSVEKEASGAYKISGGMTITGITNAIEFTAGEIIPEQKYTAELTLDRFDWKIGENGSWLEQRVVDADFYLSVEIYLR